MTSPSVLCVSVALCVFPSFSPRSAEPGDSNKSGEQQRIQEMIDAVKHLLGSLKGPQPQPLDQEGLVAFQQTVTRTLQLIAQSKAKDTEGEYRKFVAVNLLGAWRDPDSSRLLLREIEFCPFFAGWRKPLSSYPAAQALVEIGSPAARAIVEERMRQPVNDQELRIFAWVIYLIDGKELGAARLDLALSKAREMQRASAQENLSRLIRVYRAIDFNDRTQWPEPPRKPRDKAKDDGK